MKRQPAVAGQFYTDNPSRLEKELASLIIPAPKGQTKAKGIVSPHAGYIYSGAVAGQVFAAIEIPPTVLIIGPNHHEAGVPAALYPDGEWITPLGSVAINSKLNMLILKHVPLIKSDSLAHQSEHSLEVQVPFIHHLRPDVTISALCVGYGDFAAVKQIGEGLAAALQDYGGEVLIVASSDMTHYESAESAQRKDELALARVLALDPEGLLQICRTERITMCGVVPTAIMLVTARELGANQASLISYATSGDVTGDNSQVVGYAGLMVW
ncbi:MAG TPA: AmmeMemoRadiSam system protein B [Desulfuromonadaceae bacterium]|jgi:hypothetical protein